MEEQVLVNSESSIRPNLLLKVIIIIALIAIALPIFMGILISDNDNESIWGQAIEAHEKAIKVNSKDISLCYHFRTYKGKVSADYTVHQYYNSKANCPLDIHRLPPLLFHVVNKLFKIATD